MTNFFKRLNIRLGILLAVLGPGIITALADNDAGGVATYSIVAAKFGYSVLFILFLVTILLALTQEMGARLAIVTGKGLGDLIREQYGIKMSLAVFIVLVLANIGTTIANFAGLTSAFDLLGLPAWPSLVLFSCMMILAISKGSYQTNQKIFLAAGFLYVVYIFSAFMARPNWSQAVSSLVDPTQIELSGDYFFSMIALVGTTITPWGQFFISSFVRDKKLTIDKLKYEKLEVYFGAFLTDFFAFFMIVAVAATLFVHNIKIDSAASAAQALAPFAGEAASLLFGIGLLTASFMGAVIIPLTTAYAFSEFFGYEGSLDSPFNQSKSFYYLFLIQIIVAALIVLIPQISLFKIVLFTQGLNGMLLPVIIYFLLKFANNEDLMGKHINNRFYNIFATVSSFLIIAASVVVILETFMEKI